MQPELKPEEIIVKLQTENTELKKLVADLQKENLALKTRLNTHESKGKNYPSPVGVRTGFK